MNNLKTLKDMSTYECSDKQTFMKDELLDVVKEWIKELEKKDYLADDYPISEWTYQRRRGAIDWINIFFNLDEKL